MINTANPCFENLNDIIITNTKNVMVSGKYCFFGAIIVSNFTNNTRFEDRVLNVQIKDEQKYMTIICSSGDACIIECLSLGSCTTINFQCDGLCNITDGTGMQLGVLYS